MHMVRCTLSILLMVQSVLVAGSKPGNHPVIIALLDASLSNHGLRIVEAAKVIYIACPINCRIVLLSVKDNHATLMFSGTKEGKTDDMQRLDTILETFSLCYSPSDYAHALNFVIHARILRRLSREDSAMVVVLTHGNIAKEQSAEIITFAERIESNRGWPLLVASAVSINTVSGFSAVV